MLTRKLHYKLRRYVVSAYTNRQIVNRTWLRTALLRISRHYTCISTAADCSVQLTGKDECNTAKQAVEEPEHKAWQAECQVAWWYNCWRLSLQIKCTFCAALCGVMGVMWLWISLTRHEQQLLVQVWFYKQNLFRTFIDSSADFSSTSTKSRARSPTRSVWVAWSLTMRVWVCVPRVQAATSASRCPGDSLAIWAVSLSDSRFWTNIQGQGRC